MPYIFIYLNRCVYILRVDIVNMNKHLCRTHSFRSVLTRLSPTIIILSNSSFSIHFVSNYRQIFAIFIIVNSNMKIPMHIELIRMCTVQYAQLHSRFLKYSCRSLQYFVIKIFRVEAPTLKL